MTSLRGNEIQPTVIIPNNHLDEINQPDKNNIQQSNSSVGIPKLLPRSPSKL